jgi:hydrogenase maturation protease
MTEHGGTVVLGAGSPLMGDDGLGIVVLESVSQKWVEMPSMRFLDGGIWGMRLLPHIEDADRLLVIDAVRTGADPGTLVRLEREEIPRHLRTKISPHQIDLSEVFAVAELRGTFPREAVVLGIEPAQIDAYMEISAEVMATVPSPVTAVERQLQAWGHELIPRTGAGAGSKSAPARTSGDA